MIVDYSVGRPPIAALKDHGVTGVVRYLSYPNDLTRPKILTAAETSQLLAAGLAVTLNYEWYAGRMREGWHAGWADASTAQAQASRIADSLGIEELAKLPVLFSADWDAREADQPGIESYLDGAHDKLGSCDWDLARRRAGLYGGFWPVHRALDHGKCGYAWQTYAWSGGFTTGGLPHTTVETHVAGHYLGSAYLFDTRCVLRQGPIVTIGGAQCDVDQAMNADYGQYPRPGTPSPPAAEDLMQQPGYLLDGPGQTPIALPNGAARLRFFANHPCQVAADWIGVANPTAAPLDLGYNAGAQGYPIPEGCHAVVIRRPDGSTVPVSYVLTP